MADRRPDVAFCGVRPGGSHAGVPRLRADEKVDRDARIVAERARGLSWGRIAQRHGLSERHCRAIWSTYRERNADLEAVDPLEAVQEALLQYEAVIDELAVLAEEAVQDAVRLGAIRSRLGAIEGRLGLMQAVGLLPAEHGFVRDELEKRQLVRVLVGVFGRYGLPPEAEAEIRAALRPRAASLNGSRGRVASLNGLGGGDGRE